MPRIFALRLLAGDVSAAKAIGLDPALLANRPPGPPDEAAVAFVRPMVEKASLALCVNEAWAMLACVAIAGLLLVPFARDRADPKAVRPSERWSAAPARSVPAAGPTAACACGP